MHTHIRTHTHTNIYQYINKNSYVHTHTHTHTHSHSRIYYHNCTSQILQDELAHVLRCGDAAKSFQRLEAIDMWLVEENLIEVLSGEAKGVGVDWSHDVNN